jgi:hypothetical protein
MMFLVIKIGNITATLYRDGWYISSGKISIDQEDNLIVLLETIMSEPVYDYVPNLYYAKGQEIEKAIKGSEVLYYMGQNETEHSIPENTVY